MPPLRVRCPVLLVDVPAVSAGLVLGVPRGGAVAASGPAGERGLLRLQHRPGSPGSVVNAPTMRDLGEWLAFCAVLFVVVLVLGLALMWWLGDWDKPR